MYNRVKMYLFMIFTVMFASTIPSIMSMINSAAGDSNTSTSLLTKSQMDVISNPTVIFYIIVGIALIAIVIETIIAIKGDSASNSSSTTTNTTNNYNNTSYSYSDQQYSTESDAEYNEFSQANSEIKDKFGVDVNDIMSEKNHIDVIKDMVKVSEKKIKSKNIDEFILNMNKTIEYAYLADIIKDDLLDKYNSKIEKLTAIINLATGTNFEGEKNVAIKKAFDFSKSLLEFVKKDVFGELFKLNVV